MDPERWNHNIHLHPLILEAVPAGARRALDVGCGEGMLTRELRSQVDEVVGIDLDGPSIELARAAGGEGIEYVPGDVLTHPLAPGSFDLVASVATLHHMDSAAGLGRMGELLRPGGVLVVVGLARTRSPLDLAYDLGGAVTTRWLERTRTYWEHSAPMVWPPPQSYGQLRRTAERVLPGVRYRRHVLWRCSLTWTKPPADPG
jgi:2-polyprenyl-3-methyl-5-hydroxy-6-metoxy-1,4-benzoquinol methylase